VSAVPSPPEVSRRLLLCGMRPIDSIVDASNYVMLELGQPTHPYDLDLLGGGLVARAGREGERVTTLDGVERAVLPTDCLIADPSGRAVGIGGVMGGGETEISAATSRVVLEAAHFVPLAIARTARRLGLRSEASVRFERGCDPEMPELAGLRYYDILAKAAREAGAPAPLMLAGLLDARPVPAVPLRLTVRAERVNALLGTDLDEVAMRSYLEPIGFATSGSHRGVFEVTVPSFRPDVTREADIVEEVARHHGYERIPSRERRSPGVGALVPHQKRRRDLRRALCGIGAHEAWTSSFVSPADHAKAGLAGDEVRLTNPMVAEESVLRRSLLPGLLAALSRNAARRSPHLRFFEIGHVFSHSLDHGLPLETEVAALLLGREGDGAEEAVRAWRLVADSIGVEGVAIVAGRVGGLHPSRSAHLVGRGGEVIGSVGEIDPEVGSAFALPHRRVGWVELLLRPLLAIAGARRLVTEPSRYPSADVDLAFAVDEAVPADEVEARLREAAGELCESLQLFDVYRGAGVEEGRRSLAFRLRLCAEDHTLTDAEIATARQACVTAVERALPARLRG
jgi:phenylalanyl-tRNA synthetase beta chain